MCGIVGYAGFTKKVLLGRAIDAIGHRGPDDNGTAYFEGTALGNTRLAIIDLSKQGHQPMFNQDKSLCIVFNGEIYNFKETKKLLEKKYRFRSHTDTEVVLYAYQEWGVKCLERLNGMFSIVIYDMRKQLLFGARDRLGQKPLKYFFKNGQFIFASEIKGILPLLENKPDMDPSAIDAFLTLQYVPTPKTGFRHIYKLPPAHYFIYKNNQLSIHKYWSLHFDQKSVLSRSAWQDLIYSEMERAVVSHMISDVPIGALLSGGLDSSLIVAFMSKNSGQKIHTFSIGFDDKRLDETSYAKMVSDMYGTDHKQFCVRSNDFLEHIEGLARYFDEPLADNSMLPTLLVSRMASRYVKVALTGDGGDENFAGYDRYVYVYLRRVLSKIPVKTVSPARFFADGLSTLKPSRLADRANRFISSVGGEFYKKYILYNSFFLDQIKHDLYTNDFKNSVRRHNTEEIYKKFFDRGLEDVDNALQIDIHTYLPDDLLYKSDIASMAHSLELRAPFLDHELIENTAAMPAEIKISLWGNKKKILKDIACKYNLLPKSIILRPKQGFVVPLAGWLKGPLKKYATDTILSSKVMEKIFEKKKLEGYVTNYYTHNLPYANNIFALLMLSLWLDTYQ